MQLTRAQRGFTLTELAVVFLIVALLIGGTMMTLSARVEQRNHEETRSRLNAAVEALIAFAIVNRRLPCPAIDGATGVESETAPGSRVCNTYFGGLLPARSLGIQETDSQGYALDAWNNRIRYAVSNAVTGCTIAPSGPPFFTSELNLKANGVSCQPNDIDICAPVDTSTPCTSTNRVVSTQTVALIVLSTGKNGAVTGFFGPHENANVDGNATFISRTPSGSDALNGTFDDLMVWVPAGVLYSKLINAGVLP